jgi:hypothetical protein
VLLGSADPTDSTGSSSKLGSSRFTLWHRQSRAGRLKDQLSGAILPRQVEGLFRVAKILAFRGLSRPIPVSSYVAVADFEGIVHLVSQVDGEFAGRVKVDGDGVRADMMSDGNVLYVFGNSGKLVAFEITPRE